MTAIFFKSNVLCSYQLKHIFGLVFVKKIHFNINRLSFNLIFQISYIYPSCLFAISLPFFRLTHLIHEQVIAEHRNTLTINMSKNKIPNTMHRYNNQGGCPAVLVTRESVSGCAPEIGR